MTSNGPRESLGMDKLPLIPSSGISHNFTYTKNDNIKFHKNKRCYCHQHIKEEEAACYTREPTVQSSEPVDNILLKGEKSKSVINPA